MKKWTSEDEDYLIENYLLKSESELETALDRTWTAIRVRLDRLKQRGIAVPKRLSRWSDDDDHYLIEAYPSAEPRVIQQRLNRSWTAIHQRAHRLQVNRPNRKPIAPHLEKINKKIQLDGNDLIKKYCEDELTLEQIGYEVGTSGKTVMRRLTDLGVARRSSGPGPNCVVRKLEISKEELEHYYFTQNLTYRQIGKILGFSGEAIARRAKNLGIVARSIWKGYGEIGGWYWKQLQGNAKNRRIELQISIEDAWDLFLQQDRRCALSGLQLVFSSWNDRLSTTASLDRIDSNFGYIPGNVQWIHKKFQPMKMAMDNSEFIENCNIIADHNQ